MYVYTDLNFASSVKRINFRRNFEADRRRIKSIVSSSTTYIDQLFKLVSLMQHVQHSTSNITSLTLTSSNKTYFDLRRTPDLFNVAMTCELIHYDQEHLCLNRHLNHSSAILHFCCFMGKCVMYGDTYCPGNSRWQLV